MMLKCIYQNCMFAVRSLAATEQTPQSGTAKQYSAAAKNRDGNANAVDCIPVLQAAQIRCLLDML